MEKPLVNRVAKSRMITIDLGSFYPDHIVDFDLKDFLFQELVLREKDFRTALKAFDFEPFTGKPMRIFCSTDAIIPMWAYMLVASHAGRHGIRCYFDMSTDDIAAKEIIKAVHDAHETASIEDGLFILKGCSDQPVHPHVYGALTDHLIDHGAKSVMFGEPCSTVPIYKRPK